MAKLNLFFMYVRLEFQKKTHLVSLYELRFFMITWGLIIFSDAVFNFITLQIGIAEALFFVLYSIILIRAPYVFGINSNQTHEHPEEWEEWEATYSYK